MLLPFDIYEKKQTNMLLWYFRTLSKHVRGNIF